MDHMNLLSTNLLAACLFDIAHGVDAARGDGEWRTLKELMIFCIAAYRDREALLRLIDHVLDPRSEAGAASLARADVIMEHSSIESAVAVEAGRGEMVMLARGLSRLTSMQIESTPDAVVKRHLRAIHAACMSAAPANVVALSRLN